VRYWIPLLTMGCLVSWTEDTPKSDTDVADTDVVDSDLPEAEDTDQAWSQEPVDSDDPGADTDGDPGGPTSFSDGSAPADTCAEAKAMPPLALGDFSGTMVINGTAGLDLPCIGRPTRGKDGWFKVAVPPGRTLDVWQRFTDSDAQLALVRDCDQPATTCMLGRDDAWVGFGETVVWPNNSTDWAEVYLFIGTFHHDSNAGPYLMEVSLR
jgi:hypothetical protein